MPAERAQETSVRYVQIGWLADAIADEEELTEVLAGSNPFGPDVVSLDDYKAVDLIYHSHGPIQRPIPVYIDVRDIARAQAGRAGGDGS